MSNISNNFQNKFIQLLLLNYKDFKLIKNIPNHKEKIDLLYFPDIERAKFKPCNSYLLEKNDIIDILQPDHIASDICIITKITPKCIFILNYNQLY